MIQATTAADSSGTFSTAVGFGLRPAGASAVFGERLGSLNQISAASGFRRSMH